MKSFQMLIILLILLITASTSNAKNNYEGSEFMKYALKGMFSWEYARYNKGYPDFSVLGTQSSACPSRYWGWGNANNTLEEKREILSPKLEQIIRKQLKGFPKETIDFCASDFEWIIKNGQVTDHHLNDQRSTTTVATVLISDLTSGAKPTPLLALLENDYLFERTYGKIYNANLDQICETTFVKGDERVALDCGALGSGDAMFKVTNAFKGEFTLYWKSDEVKFFMSNMDIKILKRKYPEMFGLKKNSSSNSTNNLSTNTPER